MRRVLERVEALDDRVVARVPPVRSQSGARELEKERLVGGRVAQRGAQTLDVRVQQPERPANGPRERSAREGARVEVAGDDCRPAPRHRLDHHARLAGPARRGVADLQVGAREVEPPCFGLEPRDDGDAPAVALLVEVIRLEADRQPHDAHPLERVPRQDRVALEADRVLAGRLEVRPHALRQLDVRRGEGPVHPEPLGQLASDVAVAGPRHPEVDLVEKDDVRAREVRMRREARGDAIESEPLLDVPLHEAEVARRGRRAARGPADERRLEQRFEVTPALGVEARRPQRHEAVEAPQSLDEVTNLHAADSPWGLEPAVWGRGSGNALLSALTPDP
jgi:hypothetical protein